MMTPEQALEHLYITTRKVGFCADDHDRCAIAYKTLLVAIASADKGRPAPAPEPPPEPPK